MKTLLTAIVSILFSVAAQFILKRGVLDSDVQNRLGENLSLSTLLSTLFNPYIFGGFVLYGIGAIIWLSVLSKWDVSKAYPLVGLGFVFTAIIAVLIGEDISFLRLCGISMICVGILAIAIS